MSKRKSAKKQPAIEKSIKAAKVTPEMAMAIIKGLGMKPRGSGNNSSSANKKNEEERRCSNPGCRKKLCSYNKGNKCYACTMVVTDI
jgi:hypothetical protein